VLFASPSATVKRGRGLSIIARTPRKKGERERQRAFAAPLNGVRLLLPPLTDASIIIYSSGCILSIKNFIKPLVLMPMCE
jgi:hypothetical protein